MLKGFLIGLLWRYHSGMLEPFFSFRQSLSMSSFYSFLLVIGLGSFVFPEVLEAEKAWEPTSESPRLPEHKPQICLAYHSAVDGWGWSALRGHPFGVCERHSALIEIDDVGHDPYESLATYFDTSCCPLPAPDILAQEESLAEGFCPHNFVVTGRVLLEVSDKRASALLHCTKINTQRYQLSEPMPGVYWGRGSGMTFLNESKVIKHSDIPVALRYGVGRVTKTSWDVDGCVGNPAGSLMVGRVSRRCGGIFFSELQFAGLRGDPERGTAVPMFPECRAVKDIFAIEPKCVR